VLQIIKVFDYNYIYYAVRCLYTLHMYTANCLLLHFMLSYYQVMFWPAGLCLSKFISWRSLGGDRKFSGGISLVQSILHSPLCKQARFYTHSRSSHNGCFYNLNILETQPSPCTGLRASILFDDECDATTVVKV